MISFYGKLPTTGDFLTVEVPRDILRPMEDWLNTSLATSRDAIDGDWNTVFDAAPAWRFWIGGNVLGQGIAGVMRPSRDKVGRRFPAVLFASDPDASKLVDAPVIDPDQEFYENLTGELDYLSGLTPAEVSERLKAASSTPSGLGEPNSPDTLGPDFWAVAPEEGPDGWDSLVQDAAYADHQRATAGRSYWWSPTGAGTNGAMYSTEGTPQPQVFAWFLTGLSHSGLTGQTEAT